MKNDTAAKTTELVTYVRNKKFVPVGLVMATKTKRNGVVLTWSKCMKTDMFRRDEGLRIARERVSTGITSCLPRSFMPYLETMTERAKNTFGVKKVRYIIYR